MSNPIRGYAPWRPKPETEELIEQVQLVLAEYRAFLPISLRQIFYRLVAEYGYAKTEAAYDRLGSHVARARRAQMLDFDVIRDDQGKPTEVMQHESAAGFWDDVRENAAHFRLDRMAGQPIHAEVWSEAGMTEQLFRVASQYGIAVYSSRGFASVTNSHAIAERARAREVPTVLFHVGDYDPSGESIFTSITQDARAFLRQKRVWDQPDLAEERDGKSYLPRSFDEGADIIPVRVALTEEQVEQYEVETAPPKPSDSRSASWYGETAQAEALPPDLLANILTDAIEEKLDLEQWETIREEERIVRQKIIESVPADE